MAGQAKKHMRVGKGATLQAWRGVIYSCLDVDGYQKP